MSEPKLLFCVVGLRILLLKLMPHHPRHQGAAELVHCIKASTGDMLSAKTLARHSLTALILGALL